MRSVWSKVSPLSIAAPPWTRPASHTLPTSFFAAFMLPATTLGGTTQFPRDILWSSWLHGGRGGGSGGGGSSGEVA